MQRRSDMAAGGAVGNQITYQQTLASQTVRQLTECAFICEVCGGKGHEYWECPTLTRLDKFACNNGEAQVWSVWKYHTFLHNFSAEER